MPDGVAVPFRAEQDGLGVSLWGPPISSFLGNLWMCALLASIVCALALPARALDPNKTISQYTHTSWSAKDGIPGPVWAIAQTLDGYLWFGTEAGLYRFDGREFVAWEPTGTDDKLPRSPVRALLAGRDGSLWIGFNSSAISQLRSGVLKTYTSADGVHTGGTQSMVEDQNGTIWAGGLYGFSRFRNGRWTRVGADLGYPAPGAQKLLVDRHGTLWVATNGLNFGLGKDSIRVNTILKLPLNAKRFEATGTPVGAIGQLAEAPDGEIWMAEPSGPGPTVRSLEGRSGPNIERAVTSEPLRILFDGPTDLWIGLGGTGILRAPDYKRLEQNSFDHFGSKDGLSSDTVLAVFKDREGNIWFGTTVGVDRFRENKATPILYRDALGVALTSIRDGPILGINYATDVVLHFHGGRIVSQMLPSYSSSDTTRILSVYSDNNHVWLGGSFGLAESMDGKLSYVRPPGTPVGSTVEAITSDSSGSLWMVVWEGGARIMRLSNGRWTDFGTPPELPDVHCRVMFGDAQGRIWLGFESGGVVVYENGRFHRYSASDGLPPDKVLTITGDGTGHVWVGGEGGLSHLDGRRFVTLTKENGLPGNSVSAILKDNDGFLWIAGDLGIVRVRPQELEHALRSPSYRMQRLLLDTTDGLPGLPREGDPSPAAAKAADGRLWFVTTEGIAVIDPAHLPMNTVPPPVVIQTVTADNRSFAISPELHLPPNVRTLEIGFAALSLTVPERVLCRYKLEGFDNEWHGPSDERSATYTNLPPRSYRFRVACANNDGVWNDQGATLKFAILPAWYQMLWFRALCAVAFLLLLWSAYLLRVRHLRRQERKLRNVVETIPAFVWTALPDGSIDSANNHWEEFSGLSAEKTAGSGWLQALHPEDQNRHAQKWRASVSSGRPFENEVRFRRANGEYRWFLVRAVPMRGPHGKIVRWYGTATDIEDRKRAEEERERLRQLEDHLAHVNRIDVMGELAASIAHELNQPLSGVVVNGNACMRWLAGDSPNLEEARENARRIVRDGKRAGDIIARVRAQATKTGSTMTRLDMNEAIEEVIALAQPEVRKNNITLQTELAGDLWPVWGDRVQLQQVVLNLVMNAVEAMAKVEERPRELAIRTQNDEADLVLITVQDSGTGLHPQNRERIFEAFYTTKSGGMGMGLSICRSIVQKHGGQLMAVANDGPGTTFQFTVQKYDIAIGSPVA